MKKLLVFAGWAISGFFLVIALVSLLSPGSTKLTLGIIVWGLTFFPPLWKKTMTIEYGVIANIAMRIVAAIVAPFVGYLITPGDVPDKAQVAVVSKQPVKAIEKVTSEPAPAKIVAAKPEQAAKAVEPKTTQCEKDVKFASEVDRMHDAHSDIYPAFESCDSIGEFVEAVNKYPIATNNTNPKTYLAGICAENENLKRGICADVPKMSGITTIYYLAAQGTDLPAPVGDKASILTMVHAGKIKDEDLFNRTFSNGTIFNVKDEPIDVIAREGDLVQVRLHATDINGQDLEGRVLWTSLRFLQASYSYSGG
jgi:hypothetical protein